ncbi:short-chain dehydrogenase/reductase SDR [Caballeronia pedi]|uniref:Short-chain dehydrogenase/reductase SDR n=1 Tax=Caballeronia pedi TaxID=1777141 RepID=A0A158A1H0_9BURK|nr:short-chain dehydrogenase/reductase SDR [Caballeronia pedi]
MSHATTPAYTPQILIVGASRGLGYAMAADFVRKGWNVIGTVRAGSHSGLLHALADANPRRIEIETVDITSLDEIESLRARLSDRTLDILFVNAGTTNPEPTQTIGEVSTQDFADLMITNALGPMRVVERLSDLVPADGLIGVMSSGQGSIADNESGQREVYRGSKAALNQFMRSFAARQPRERALLLMAPGWVRTELVGLMGDSRLKKACPASSMF